MNAILRNIVIISAFCLSATGTEATPRPTGPDITKAIALCTQDYRTTYRKGAALSPNDTRVSYRYVTAAEARQHNPNMPELKEEHYLLITIGKPLKKNMVGGSAYYVVRPTDGSIIYRWHTK